MRRNVNSTAGRLVLAAISATCLAWTTGASAAAFTNGSFELAPPGNTILGPGSNAIPGWTTVGEGVEWFTPTAFGFGPAYDGSSAIDLAWYTSNGNPGGGISQTFDTVVGQTYEVSFYGVTATGFGRVGTGIIDAYIDNSLLGSLAVTHVAPSWTLNDWQHFSQTFVATGTSTTLTLRNTQDALTHFADVDAVGVTAVGGAVPEPAGWALMIGGLGAAGAVLRHRRVRLAT